MQRTGARLSCLALSGAAGMARPKGRALRIDDGVVLRAFESIAPHGQPAACAAAMHLLEVCPWHRSPHGHSPGDTCSSMPLAM